jgi:hypothetical protein
MGRTMHTRTHNDSTPRFRSFARLSLAASLALLLAACGGLFPQPGPTPVGDLSIDTPTEPLIGDFQTLVQLTGENIAGNATVTVGDEAATNIVVRGDEDQIVTGDTRTGTMISFNPPELEPGVYDITVSQGTGEDAESVTLEGVFQYESATVDPVDLPLYLNAGGPEVESGGVTWLSDEPYLTTPGLTTAANIAIAGTDDDVIYQTERFASTAGTLGGLTYVIPVAEAGTYEVTLHFAEIFFGQPGNPDATLGQRVFDIGIQNALVFGEFDIFAATGGQIATAVTETFTVEVLAGAEAIQIELANVEDRAKVSAIEIQAVDNGDPVNGDPINGDPINGVPVNGDPINDVGTN